MTWAATGSTVAGGVIGGLTGGGGQENFGPGNYIPKWMKQDWQNAGNNMWDIQAPEYFNKDTVAGMNPYLQQNLQSMAGYGQQGGMGYNNAAMQGLAGANALQQGMGGGLDYMNQLRQGGPNQFQYDQGTYDQVMGNLQPGMQGQYDAAMRDPTRQFNEQTLPGINMGSIGSGGSFGTKAFNQGAIASRGLQDRAADTASGIWSNAANQANQAAYGAGGQNLQSANNMQGDLLRNYGNYAQLGGNLLNNSHQIMQGGLNMGNLAGGQQQAYDQSLVDAEKARWDFNQNQPWDQFNRQMQGVNYFRAGGPGGGGTNTGFSNAMNGAQTGMALFNMFNQGGGGGGGVNPNFGGGWNGQSYGYW